MIPNSYRGREQSYIKHQFLTRYLQTAAYKILQGRSPIFNFVDAFAGPWRVSDEDYSDPSFHQALRTLEAVRTDLGENGIGGLKPRERRVKMRLLLGTHSAKGLEVFRDVQGKVEKREIKTRNQLRSEGQRQVSLFSDDEIAALQQQAAGIGCPEYLREAETRIVTRLSKVGSQAFSAITAHVLETIPIRLPQSKMLVNDMKDRRILTFELPPRKQKPQETTRISLLKS